MQAQPKALVLGGKTGLLGQALVATLEAHGWSVSTGGPSRKSKLDSATTSEKLSALIDAVRPELIFNTIGYTQVDAAEDNKEEAILLNRTFPTLLGRIVKERDTRLVHYSTDFVFDGKAKEPYSPEHEPSPMSVYAKTKLEGEESLLELDLPSFNIIRTAWLFGPFKNNFITTIFNLCKKEPQVRVVHDQIGSPTYTMDLALYSLKLAEAEANGIFHIVNSGTASWCDLASEAVRLRGCGCIVRPIDSKDYPQKAQRPPYSPLDHESFTKVTGIAPRPWAQALCDYIYRYIIPEQADE